MRTKLLVLSGFLLSGALAAACMSMTVGDESMYLTGTEEYAITLANGQPGCTNPKKVLICHIPPGNPANQHDICVSTHAVEAHQTHHGDAVGACSPQPPPPSGDDAGTTPPPSDDGGTPTPSDDGGVVL